MYQNPSRSVTLAYPGNKADTASTISWYWLAESTDISNLVANPSTAITSFLSAIGTPFHTSELIPGNYSNFPSEYVLLDEYKLGRYLFFNQEYETGATGPLSIGDVIPNFAEMRKFSRLC